ncbi:hypothetical protein PRIPAC_88169, partial [Pristionchus pacificus]|uniref:Uncharacterized protein n=1 Tax=Pristionchus pacificus TaxID=54126 RepID=A0A2A6CV42_PRIPA
RVKRLRLDETTIDWIDDISNALGDEIVEKHLSNRSFDDELRSVYDSVSSLGAELWTRYRFSWHIRKQFGDMANHGEGANTSYKS